MAKKEESDSEIEKSPKKPAPKAKKAAPKKAAPKKAKADGPKKEPKAKKAGPPKKGPKAKKEDGPKAPKPPKKEEAPAEVRGTIEPFEAEHMDFEKETFPNCKIKYIAKPRKPLWDKANKKAIKKISKDVSIPGFRKGKAPSHIILQKHAAQVEKQTETELANICFEECQKVAKMAILHGNNNISFHLEDKDAKHPILIFHFEAEPTIPEIQYDQFNLKTMDNPAVDEARIQEEIDQVRGFYATWEQIEDRPVEMGDFVLLDIDDMDQDPPTQVFNAARFEVTEEKMAPWMRDLVIGKSKTESTEGISKPDDKASEEDKKNFKEKKVKITINSIEKSTLPAIDDDLAKKLGATDVEDMKTKLKHLVESKAERTRMQELRVDIELQMIEKILFDVPATLLEKEANHRVSQLFNNADFKKKWEEEFSEEQKEEKKEEIKEKSNQAIRLFYLCRHIVNKNKISVGDSDMEGSFDSVLDMMYADQSKLQYKSMSEEQKQMALTQVMMHKAEDHIIQELEKVHA